MQWCSDFLPGTYYKLKCQSLYKLEKCSMILKDVLYIYVYMLWLLIEKLGHFVSI